MGHVKVVLRVLGPSQKLALIRPFQGNSSLASRLPDLLWETACESCLHHNTPGCSEQPRHSGDGCSWQLSAEPTSGTCFWLKKDTWFRVMSHSQGWPMNNDWVMKQDQGPALSSKRLLLFSPSVVSDSLQPHGLQPLRLLCLPLSPRVCSNSCPLSR